MGDRRPSQLLQQMRDVLPDGIGDATIKEFWLGTLPPRILAIVASLDGPLDYLANCADRVAYESAISDLTTQIAALNTH